MGGGLSPGDGVGAAGVRRRRRRTGRGAGERGRVVRRRGRKLRRRGRAGKRGRKRRGKRRHGGRFSGRVVPESDLRTEALPRPSGNLEIVSLANASERAKVNIY